MSLQTEKLKEYFNHCNQFTMEDLYQFYKQTDKNANESVLFWNVYALQTEQVIKPISANVYQLMDRYESFFLPNIESKILLINELLISKFPQSTMHCLWSTAWLNQWMTHQVIRSMIIIELEPDKCESFFYAMHDAGWRDVFLWMQKSDEVLLERYIFEAEQPIVIMKIIRNAPIKKHPQMNIKIPKWEKIIVDLFCDNLLFSSYNAEQNNIFKNILQQYNINFKTLFAYAERRKKELKLKQYLYQNFKSIIQIK
jgi:hypothetical protein